MKRGEFIFNIENYNISKNIENELWWLFYNILHKERLLGDMSVNTECTIISNFFIKHKNDIYKNNFTGIVDYDAIDALRKELFKCGYSDEDITNDYQNVIKEMEICLSENEYYEKYKKDESYFWNKYNWLNKIINCLNTTDDFPKMIFYPII